MALTWIPKQLQWPRAKLVLSVASCLPHFSQKKDHQKTGSLSFFSQGTFRCAQSLWVVGIFPTSPGWPPYTENFYDTIPRNKNHDHTIPYIKCMEKMLCHTIFIHFQKTIEKKINHFCGFLRTIEQTGDKKKLFVCAEFCTQTNNFRKSFFLHAKFNLLCA